MIKQNGVEMPEPEFIEESGKMIVKPTARIPIGQYLLVGNDYGVVFPSVPFGPKGAKYANALNKMLSLVLEERFDPLMNGMERMTRDQAALLPQLTQELGEVVTKLYAEGLYINYDEQSVVWILDNLPVDLRLLKKLLTAAQGGSVDVETFPSQRD